MSKKTKKEKEYEAALLKLGLGLKGGCWQDLGSSAQRARDSGRQGLRVSTLALAHGRQGFELKVLSLTLGLARHAAIIAADQPQCRVALRKGKPALLFD